MKEHRRSGHSISILMVHLVWVTKYRYPVLGGEIQQRCREILIQICDSEDIRILKGVVSKDHIHMHIEYPAKLSISNFVKRLKGRSSRRIQDEFPELKKRYWGDEINLLMSAAAWKFRQWMVAFSCLIIIAAYQSFILKFWIF